MSDARAVVLGDSAAGLRAAAWLARQGVAVRSLCVGRHRGDVLWPSAVLGVPAELDRWLGPTSSVVPRVGLLYRGQIRPMPRRRRDLARVAGGTWAELASDLRPHFRDPRALGQWGPRHLGRKGWRRVLRGVVSKRLGLSADGEPATLAGLLIAPPDARWRAVPVGPGQAVAADVDAVLDAGGEPLESVEVHGLEVEDGAVRAVMTEFGREHVEGPLYCDLAPARLAAWLGPGTLPPEVLRTLQTLPVQERAVVVLDVVDVAHLPWEVRVADTSVPVVRVMRAWGDHAAPRPDRVLVELECAPDRRRAVQLARRALEPFMSVVSVADVVRTTVPVPRVEAAVLRALAALRRLGIQPVGSMAHHLPLDLGQEARLAASWRGGGGLTSLLSIPSTHHGVLP